MARALRRRAAPKAATSCRASSRPRPSPGFAHPTPLALTRSSALAGKALIYSTTNGTVALAKSASASQVYAAALVNARAVVEHVQNQHPGDTVLLVCAGSMENFNLEDFYGAGHLVTALRGSAARAVELSDAALAAKKLHDGTQRRSNA